MCDSYRKLLITELEHQHSATSETKDIIIVVKDQFNHTRNCLESIVANTKNYRLFLWDNGSEEKTKSLLLNYDAEVLVRSKTNKGFIEPNNYLASLTTSPYLVLLNSDTIVSPGWDTAMLGLLQKNENIAITGYGGRKLNDQLIGDATGHGEDIDYIEGWCLCVPRRIYKEFGLFDPNLKFAYGEDSEYSIRVKNANYKVYALHLQYVKHIGNATAKEVIKKMDLSVTFRENHEYIKKKWGSYLESLKIKHGKKKIY